MKVGEIMTRDVEIVTPDTSVREAARRMDELNVGLLPVCDGQHLVGVLSERDITLGAAATGDSPDVMRVGEVMTEDVGCCSADDEVEDVVLRMADARQPRMPVVDGEHMLVGMVSLGDLARRGAPGAELVLKSLSGDPSVLSAAR